MDDVNIDSINPSTRSKEIKMMDKGRNEATYIRVALRLMVVAPTPLKKLSNTIDPKAEYRYTAV
jgi:hypothetical protein